MNVPGSQSNLRKLVDEHYASLYRYAYRLSGSAGDAEDLTQDTFCQAQEKYFQLRDPDKARAWLFRILRNGYLRRLRDDKKQNTVSLEWVGEVADGPPEELPMVDGDQLQEALSSLPEAYRTPIVLYYFEDFSYRDIAEQMELPIGTVMSRLARAKGHLRKKLRAATQWETQPERNAKPGSDAVDRAAPESNGRPAMGSPRSQLLERSPSSSQSRTDSLGRANDGL